MKRKTPAPRFALLLLISLLWNAASVFTPSTDYLPAREVGAENVGDSSDYRYITVWGAPFPFIQDMLNSQSIGNIDNQDRFFGSEFFADWLFWFVVSWPLSFVAANLYRFLVRFAREFANPTQEK